MTSRAYPWCSLNPLNSPQLLLKTPSLLLTPLNSLKIRSYAQILCLLLKHVEKHFNFLITFHFSLHFGGKTINTRALKNVKFVPFISFTWEGKDTNNMFLILITSLVCIAGVSVNLYIVFHILRSDYQKTVFDLGYGIGHGLRMIWNLQNIF